MTLSTLKISVLNSHLTYSTCIQNTYFHLAHSLVQNTTVSALVIVEHSLSYPYPPPAPCTLKNKHLTLSQDWPLYTVANATGSSQSSLRAVS